GSAITRALSTKSCHVASSNAAPGCTLPGFGASTSSTHASRTASPGLVNGRASPTAAFLHHRCDVSQHLCGDIHLRHARQLTPAGPRVALQHVGLSVLANQYVDARHFCTARRGSLDAQRRSRLIDGGDLTDA